MSIESKAAVAMKAGQLLGPEFDGASLVEVAEEVVRLRSELRAAKAALTEANSIAIENIAALAAETQRRVEAEQAATHWKLRANDEKTLRAAADHARAEAEQRVRALESSALPAPYSGYVSDEGDETEDDFPTALPVPDAQKMALMEIHNMLWMKN